MLDHREPTDHLVQHDRSRTHERVVGRQGERRLDDQAFDRLLAMLRPVSSKISRLVFDAP